ncbi:MAG: UbiA family prenyltransferase [Thermodesulfobacteriota bacterium]
MKMNNIVKDLFYLLRPVHWVKNLLVVAPAFFGGIVFSSFEIFFTAILSFFSFSLASSVGYIFNDLFDVDNDKNHPVKKNRPIASGRVIPRNALVLALFLLIVSIFIALKINNSFTIILLSYLVLTASYSLGLKNLVIIESLCIAGGFLLRIAGGGASSGLSISGWLMLTTLFLSLLLAFGKRRSELNMSLENKTFRKVLAKYDKVFLDYMLVVFAASSIITYSIYLINTSMGFILITIPLACFGVVRYVYLARKKSKGDPIEVLLKDYWLLACVIAWLIIKGLAIYVH